MFALGGALVSSVWRLRTEIRDVAHPVDDLDARRPGWCDELPLRLEDEVAQELLRGLVRDALEVARRPRVALRAEATAERAGDAWVLRRRVRCPSSLDAQALAEALGCGREALPPRFSLYLQPRGGRALLLAHCTRRAGEDDGFYLDGHGRAGLELPPDAALAPLELAAVSARAVVATAALPGGDALDEAPWVFAEDAAHEGVLRLVATASCKVRGAAVWVAAAGGAAVTPEAGASVTPAGPIGARSLVRVEGAAAVADAGGETFRVATGSGADDHDEGRAVRRRGGGAAPGRRGRAAPRADGGAAGGVRGLLARRPRRVVRARPPRPRGRAGRSRRGGARGRGGAGRRRLGASRVGRRRGGRPLGALPPLAGRAPLPGGAPVAVDGRPLPLRRVRGARRRRRAGARTARERRRGGAGPSHPRRVRAGGEDAGL